jgi:hypothetical protein
LENIKSQFLNLKKLCFIFLLILTFHQNGNCQFQIGFKTGYNFFKYLSNWDKPGEYAHTGYFDEKHSFTFGIPIKYHIYKNSDIDFEVCYQSYSFDYKFEGSVSGSYSYMDYKYNLGYIFLHFSPTIVFGSTIKFSIKPGLQFGYLVYNSATGTSWGYNAGVKEQITLNNQPDQGLGNEVFGFQLGFGIVYPINNKFNLILENINSLHTGPNNKYLWGIDYGFFNASIETGILYKFNKVESHSKSKKK